MGVPPFFRNPLKVVKVEKKRPKNEGTIFQEWYVFKRGQKGQKVIKKGTPEDLKVTSFYFKIPKIQNSAPGKNGNWSVFLNELVLELL